MSPSRLISKGAVHRGGKTRSCVVPTGCIIRPRQIDDAFYAKLKAVYNDPQIVELIATASVFEFFPRFVDALRIPVTPAPKNSSAGQV